MWQRRQNARGVTAWWGRYRVRPAVQVGLAVAVGVAAFGLAAVVSPHLRDLDGDALFVLGIFILVALLVTEIAARTGRRADESEQARSLLADEQAALRRIATLVARGVPPEEVFAAVTAEVGICFQSVAQPWGATSPMACSRPSPHGVRERPPFP